MSGPTIKVVQIPYANVTEMDSQFYAVTSKGWRLVTVMPGSSSDFLAFFERAKPTRVRDGG